MTEPELDFSEVEEAIDGTVPDDVGPAITGGTPLIGSLRRENDLPVLRDELSEEIESEF